MRERLPLFPLPVVLFPGASLPLHVFEPRYRQLVAHCLEHDMRFGLLYHDPDRHGSFRNEPGQVGCVAEIQEFQPLPDGRSVILTTGESRFRIQDGIESGALYYEALVEPYRDLPGDSFEIAERRQRALVLFRRSLERLTGSPAVLPPLEEEQDLSFQLAQWIRIDPTWQQELLELRAERARLSKLCSLLRSIVGED